MAAACATATAFKIKPSLHVEVRLKGDTGTFVRPDLVREEVCEWLSSNFINLKIDQEIKDYESLTHGSIIDSINVVDYSGATTETSSHRIGDVYLDVQAYELHDSSDIPSSSPARSSHEDGDGEQISTHVRLSHLPSKSLVGIWDSLYFDDPIPGQLLRLATRIMTIMRHTQLKPALVNWNSLLLLYGPPGGGKTSLCRALAQKLSIRLSHFFTQGRLIEVNAQSLLSKWFGESGKLVEKMFEQVHKIADDTTMLVCVLIDEVETVAGNREKTVSGHEVGDALRATNQLLTELDRLRHRSNVMVFCTTNLLAAVDGAFIDRVDFKQFIGNPSPRATYEIFRSCMNELVRCEVLTIPDEQSSADAEVGDMMSFIQIPESGPSKEHSLEDYFPSLAEVNVHLWDQPSAPGSRLWQIAQKCHGLSGRTLRRLPFLALALHTYKDPCSVSESLEALNLVVDAEVLQGTNNILNSRKGDTFPSVV